MIIIPWFVKWSLLAFLYGPCWTTEAAPITLSRHQTNAGLGQGFLVLHLQREPGAYDSGFHLIAEHLWESIRPSESLKSRLCAADHPGSAGAQPALCRCMPEEGPECCELINPRASGGSAQIEPALWRSHLQCPCI